MHLSLALNKRLSLAVLAIVQLACSRGENVLIYNPSSSVDSRGPSVSQAPPRNHYGDTTNYIINGGVESGLEPWGYQGNSVAISQFPLQARSGEFSLLVAGRTQNWHGPRMHLPQNLPVGEEFLLTVWVRLASDTPQSDLTATIKREVGGEEQYVHIDTVTVPVGQWVMLAGTYRHDAVPDFGSDFYIYIESPNVTASFYVDDLSMRKANLAINGGVEDGAEGWARFGENPVIGQTDALARRGDYSLSVTGRTENWQGASFSFAPLEKGATYRFSCWVQLADHYADNSVTLSIKLDDAAADDKFFNLDTQRASSPKWVQVAGNYTHEPEGAVQELTAFVQAGLATADYFIDDCSVRFVSAPAIVVAD